MSDYLFINESLKQQLDVARNENEKLQQELADAKSEVKRLHDKYDFQLLVKERDTLRACAERMAEGLRKAILWGECISCRVKPTEENKINWTYLEEAREALQDYKRTKGEG